VLTTGFWPSYKSVELALPQELLDGVELFRQFYEVENKHRRLSWIYSLGSAVVKGNFEPKTMELQMATMQAAICMLFNDVSELSYSDIRVFGRG
jgi:cullin 1